MRRFGNHHQDQALSETIIHLPRPDDEVLKHILVVHVEVIKMFLIIRYWRVENKSILV